MNFHFSQRKTPATNIPDPDDSQSHALQINGTPIKCVTQLDFLGITLHAMMDWSPHTNRIAGKIGKNVGILHKMKYFFTLCYHENDLQYANSILSQLWNSCMGF